MSEFCDTEAYNNYLAYKAYKKYKRKYKLAQIGAWGFGKSNIKATDIKNKQVYVRSYKPDTNGSETNETQVQTITIIEVSNPPVVDDDEPKVKYELRTTAVQGGNLNRAVKEAIDLAESEDATAVAARVVAYPPDENGDRYYYNQETGRGWTAIVKNVEEFLSFLNDNHFKLNK